MNQPLIEIRNLSNYLGEQWVHKDLNLDIQRGEITAIIGGSGSGKTTLIRCILMLNRPTSGSIKIFDTDLLACTPKEAMNIRHRWGVLFQHSALFSSLTVLENVLFPLRTFTHIPDKLQEEIALLKIALTGLPLDAAAKYPAELSGGMQKRAALARAIALDPELLFLDEPTSGLDPKSARELDDLILNLRASLNLTVVMVVHDLTTLWHASDKVAFLGDGKVLADLPMTELVKQDNPLIREYFGDSTS
ncbi:MAG: ATP-binding cassette domain-containing protein [Gammaproteobacteria bacterium]